MAMESAVENIAQPNRCAIMSLPGSAQQPVEEVAREGRISRSDRLRLLREAGFVESTVDAQHRLYRLTLEPLRELDAWFAPFRRFRSAHVAALEPQLDRINQSTPSKEDKGKTARPKPRT